MSDNRFRQYVGVLYPESVKSNWLELLSETCVPAVLSPLHDKDKNPDGSTKKPHWHLMFLFGGKKSSQQAQALFDSLCLDDKAPRCQPVNSTSGQARYFIHMDNPEKYQYKPEDVQCFNGADWKSLVMTSTDVFLTMKDICQYCATNGIVSYSDLCDFAMVSNFDWFRIISSHTVFFKEYLKSKSWTFDQKAARMSVKSQRAFPDEQTDDLC